MAYGKSNDLAKKTQSDKVLRDKAFKIVSDPKYEGYQRGLASIFYNFFDRKSSGSGIDVEPNYWLVNELCRQIIRKSKIRKFYSSFRDGIWGVDLADMQSLSKYNKGIKYLICAVDLFSKYAIANAFENIISKGRKPNKIWFDQGAEFYNNLFKRFSKINNIEIYSTYNEGKYVVAKRFLRSLINKILKHMTAV